MSEFWVLTQPDNGDGDRRLADWPAEERLEFEQVHCAVDSDRHRGVRNRITTPLSAVLPDMEPQDFVWTHLGECLVQQYVLQVFSDCGFIGYEAIPAKAAFQSWSRKPPKLWELSVIGSAGLASPDSGLRVLRTCPGCGLADYSPIKDPTRTVDRSKWDGSDFFRIKPVEGWIFVTDRVAQALRKSAFNGWQIKPLRDMKESFDIAVPGREDHP